MPTDVRSVSFNFGSDVQFGANPDPEGSDQWLMTQADDGNIYAAWGDGKGWNGAMARQYLGLTRILGEPPSLTGVDIAVQPDPGGVNHKPQGIIADQSQTMKMFTSKDVDGWDGMYTATSTDNGSNWTFHVGSIYTASVDNVFVTGIAQFGPGYTNVPAHVDSSYYYIYLTELAAPLANYGPNIYLARCLKADIFTRANHQYFAGFDGSTPTWTTTYANRKPVLSDYLAMEYHCQSWWNPQINKMILVKGQHTDQLGLYVGLAPWGPWQGIYHQQFKDALLKFTYNTPSKWISNLGLSFWIAYSGYPEYDNVNFIQGTLSLGADSLRSVY